MNPDVDERPNWRDLRPLLDNAHLLLVLRVAVPDARIVTRANGDGLTAWVHDSTASWARLTAATIRQGGPRRLADELDAAWDQWLGLGSPELYDYGLTVTASEQHAWAIDPQTGPRWPAQANSPVPNRQEHRTGRAARTLGRERQRRSGRRRKRDVTWSSRAACSCRFVPEGLAAYSGGA